MRETVQGLFPKALVLTCSKVNERQQWELPPQSEEKCLEGGDFYQIVAGKTRRGKRPFVYSFLSTMAKLTGWGYPPTPPPLLFRKCFRLMYGRNGCSISLRRWAGTGWGCRIWINSSWFSGGLLTALIEGSARAAGLPSGRGEGDPTKTPVQLRNAPG